MATQALPVAFSLVSNLVSLANGAAKGLGRVGTAGTAYLDDICSPIFIKTGATINPTGRIFLFVVTAEELITPPGFTDSINPDATITQHAKIADATLANLVQTIDGDGANNLQAATTYCFNSFSIKSFLGFTPTFWAPLVWNVSGGALSATAADFYAKHSLLT